MTKVLIVDDEAETLNVLSTFLELLGYQPITTYDPRFALMMAEREQPDCVLLDIMMPELDGFTLCKQMRSDALTKSMPIMFITAYAPLDLEERRIEAGADMVLMKPFGLDALTRSIENVIAIRSKKLELLTDAAPDNIYTFRRDANTGIFSSKLQEFLSKLDFNQ